MALNAYMELEIDGTPVHGDTSMSEIGGVDVSEMIEVYAVDHQLNVPVSAGRTAGVAQHQPLVLTKRTDRSSPQLAKALARNENVNQARILFFDADPDSGETRHFFTIQLQNARITGFKLEQLNLFYPENGNQPVREKVAFQYATITWRNEIHSTEHEEVSRATL